MARIRYSGSDPVEIQALVEHNPGQSVVLANGMEREAPDKLARELAERPYFSIVEEEPKRKSTKSDEGDRK